ncbi:MAG: hypothetical protein COY09_00100 [Candidatus Portnoybacteria bacterium CG_4_10_14_0_2_um_filter_39_11]|uniref:Uncharacterized protein n=1 Tax=Candidatus Portnoybacteria bacterium CG_4_10_14_0_2_um_filter_39_11 TaxID=1974797 RepID=A0A2M7UKH7_9BACT|nr:MAG: hypothetical protein AUJ33_03325 [Parcubacteria group bacterium CG1_02_40_25]PIZ71738.1 MAG: hypothetical protein COY09_00100 [Candidatus Portnoybacteria bacterium CG_4_10_14_0_2_um_filter_39_11]
MTNEQKITPHKTHWLFVVTIAIIGFITVAGILCWQGSMIARGQQEAKQQALSIQTQIYQAHRAKNDQWVTYTNSQYGFEFNYPKKYEYKKKETSISPQSKTLLYDVSFLSITTEETIKEQNIVAGGSDIAITIFDANVIGSRTSNKTAIHAIADGSWFSGEGPLSDTKTKTFLNYPAVEAIDRDRMLNEGKLFDYGYYYNLYVEKDGLLYNISFPIFNLENGQPYESLKAEYKEILSSFKFTK